MSCDSASSPAPAAGNVDDIQFQESPEIEEILSDTSSDTDTKIVEEKTENEKDNINEEEKRFETDSLNEKIEEPKEGMSFDSIENLVDFYRDYGKKCGFSVSKRSSARGDDQIMRYVTLICFRGGKSRNKGKNILRPRPITKTKCQAKVRAVLYEDGKWHVTGVVLEHNHSLSPGKTCLHRSNRKIKPHVKRQLLLHANAGIRVNQSINALAVEANGHENLTFINKDARNFIEKERRLNLRCGDAEALQNYFTKVQATDSNFFFVIDLDKENRLKNVFWVDARSRAAYEEFGDVVTFDTTYLTNRYDMPFAPFVGVNHHGQSTLLGCGLISREDTETFIWLFKSWLASMSNHAPSAIITDQDKAMRNAIEFVFPNVRHRWCLWHIMKKLPEKFGGHNKYESIKYALQNTVYDSLSSIEFETSWKEMIEKYKLENNEWLMGLYDERHRWVPCFVKDCFWAGMSTTQRSESMNSFFDGYVNSKTTLKQFVEKYEHALRSKVRKENEEDANSFHSRIPVVTIYLMEKQVQEAYTTSKFKEFQVELTGKMYCEIGPSQSCGAIMNYNVTEDILVGENLRRVEFKVCLVKEEGDEECDVKCNCRLFEFRGILCRHAIAVLIKEKIYSIPTKYILRRWRKDVKRRHTKVRVSYSDWSSSEEGRRYDMMCKAFFEVADLAYEFEDKCNLVNSDIAALKEKLSKSEDLSKNDPNNPKSNSKKLGKRKSNESKKILSPLVVRSKGRPPVKRLQSTVEKEVEKARKRKKRIDSKEKETNTQTGKKTYPSPTNEQAGDVVSATQESIVLGESQITQGIPDLNKAVAPPIIPFNYGFHPTGSNFRQSFLHHPKGQVPNSFTQQWHHFSQMKDHHQQSWQGDGMSGAEEEDTHTHRDRS